MVVWSNLGEVSDKLVLVRKLLGKVLEVRIMHIESHMMSHESLIY